MSLFINKRYIQAHFKCTTVIVNVENIYMYISENHLTYFLCACHTLLNNGSVGSHYTQAEFKSLFLVSVTNDQHKAASCLLSVCSPVENDFALTAFIVVRTEQC